MKGILVILLQLVAGRSKNQRREVLLLIGKLDRIGFQELMKPVVVLIEEKYSSAEDMDDGYREIDVENSESPLKEQGPINSMEDLGIDGKEEKKKGM
jgi:hypothetical protein